MGKMRGSKGGLCLKKYTLYYLEPSPISKYELQSLKEVKRSGGNKFLILGHHFLKTSKLSPLHSWNYEELNLGLSFHISLMEQEGNFEWKREANFWEEGKRGKMDFLLKKEGWHSIE
jgi:hypothetical protein